MDIQRSQEMHIPDTDLPVWMRRARQGADRGLLVVLAFCLLAAWPWIIRDGIPRDSMLENYAYRSAEYAETLREYRLYPRWSATANLGYGAPVYHYEAPGLPYLVSLLELIVTADSLVALQIVFVLSYILMGTITYSLITRFSNASAGLLGAVLYVYSPHALTSVPFAMGDAPQLLALALYPLLLWGLHRLLTENRFFDLPWVVLPVTLLFLVHPESIPTAIWLSLVMIGWHVWTGSDVMRSLMVVFAWMLGSCISSFYWLPALLERDLTGWRSAAIGVAAWRLSLADLVGTVPLIDSNAFARPPVFALGWGPIFFAGLALTAMWRRRRWESLPSAMFVAAVGLIIAGLIVWPGAVWLPGAISLCLALAGSAAIHLCGTLAKPFRVWSFGGLLLLAVVLAYPAWIFPEWNSVPLPTDAQARISYERLGLGPAVVPYRDTYPQTTAANVPPNFELMAGYAAGIVTRLQAETATDAAGISLRESQSHRDSYIISGSVKDVRLLRAYFMGWEAWLDGEPLPLLITPETGLMQLVLPATERAILEIRLKSTLLRRSAWIIATIGLGIIALVTYRRYRQASQPYFQGLQLLNTDETWVATITLLIFVAILLLTTPSNSRFTLQRPGSGLDGAAEVYANTQDGMFLIAADYDMVPVEAGKSLEVDLFWRAQRALPRNYRVAVSLENAETGARVASTEVSTPAGFPTRRWPTDGYLLDSHRLFIPQSSREGLYRLVVEVHDCVANCGLGTRRPFVNEEGIQEGFSVTLPDLIQVTR